MNKKLLSLVASLPLAMTAMFGQTITDSLNYTGAVQSWTVPCGVTSISITCYGAQGGAGATGGNSSTGGLGGNGSMSTGILAVTPGDVLNIFVGGAGATPTAGFNGGGTGGSTNAGGGGGASDVRVNSLAVSARVIVAAGGGGGGRGGCEPANVNGGDGGSGGNDGANGTTSPDGGGGFAGLTNGNGGAAGIGCGGFLGANGLTTATEIGADGGAGQSCCCFSAGSIPGGGGGGGGFVGGGGGGGGSAGTTGCSGNNKGGGGGGAGGSNYTGGVSSGSFVANSRTGNGAVYISYANPVPAPGAISGSANICMNANGVYTITAVPNATSYTWTVPSGLTIVSGQGTTTLSVTATGPTGGNITVTETNPCGTSLDSPPLAITILPSPTVTVTASTMTTCAGDPVNLTASGASTYLWTPGNATGPMLMDNPTSTTLYDVFGTDANGCVSDATVTITVNPLPSVTTNLSSITVCDGSTVTLFGQGATTYSWTGGITDNVPFTANTTTTYTVTGTDANGCVNTATADVTVNPLPTISATALPSTTVCAGDSVTAFGSGGVSYVWTGGVIDGVPFVPPTGTPSYTCTGTDANGCTNTFVGQLTVNALPVVTGVAADNSVCVSDAPVALTGSPASGTWSGPGVTASSFNPATAGVGTSNLVYTYTNGNGCTDTANVAIVVSACVGINEGNLLESSVIVYPNPTSGVFTLTVNSNVGDMQIEIVDVEGRVVYSSQEKNVTTGFSKSISLAGYPNGTYLVNLHANGEHATHPVTLTK